MSTAPRFLGMIPLVGPLAVKVSVGAGDQKGTANREIGFRGDF